MPDFTITDEIILKIAKQCYAKKETVERLNEFYKSFAIDMKQQYLAHIIRTMEELIRKVSGNKMFQICCLPVNVSEKKYDIAGAQYFENRYFTIYYHPDTDEKQLRVLLSHELGHLFLVEMYNSYASKAGINDKQKLNKNSNTEPLATIFGILAIFDKNEFYHNKTTPYKHISSEEILNDFRLFFK